MNRIAKLEKIMLIKMRKYGIQSSILTMLRMKRKQLVTKEKVKAAAEGKLKNDRDWTIYGGSVNDDLERFLTDLQSQKKVKFEFVYSFFTPKLKNEELKLVQDGNEEHLNTYSDYFDGGNPDVDVKEMEKSESQSKYVHGRCRRITIPLNLEISEIEDKVPVCPKPRASRRVSPVLKRKLPKEKSKLLNRDLVSPTRTTKSVSQHESCCSSQKRGKRFSSKFSTDNIDVGEFFILI